MVRSHRRITARWGVAWMEMRVEVILTAALRVFGGSLVGRWVMSTSSRTWPGQW